MNLDSYIVRLNEKLEATAQTERFDAAAIDKAMHGKATHLAAKVNRAILFEAGSVLLVIVAACVVMLFNNQLWVQLMASVLMALCLGMAGVYIWKYRQLNSLVKFENNTANLLQNLISAVRQFITLYSWMMAVSIFVGGIVGAAYGAIESTLPEAQASMPAALTAWYAIPVSLLSIIFILLLTKWYVYRLYGKPLQDLERCAAELENVAE